MEKHVGRPKQNVNILMYNNIQDKPIPTCNQYTNCKLYAGQEVDLSNFKLLKTKSSLVIEVGTFFLSNSNMKEETSKYPRKKMR